MALITSINQAGPVVAVGSETLVTPDTGNYTNRNLQLSGVSEILIVADGKDTGFETAYDKAELYVGVTGIDLSWQQILDALNFDTGASWSDRSYAAGFDDPWQFVVTRVNTTGLIKHLGDRGIEARGIGC